MQKNNEKGYIENVKGFKHVHFQFSPQWNVIDPQAPSPC